MKSNLKQGIVIIFISNLINMGFKVFINFAQPAFLPVETYAMIQTFNLYISYVGLLHLGYVDGAYLKYGGKVLEDCDKEALNKNISTIRSLQILVSVGVILVGALFRDAILAAVGCIVLPANMTAYYRMLFQATGKYKSYGRVINVNTFLLFLYNFLLIFVFHVENYLTFLLCEVIVSFVVFFALEFKVCGSFRETKSRLFSFSLDELKSNVSEGLPLTLGNLSSVLFTSLDRWFVKILLTASEFAYYTFAVSIETFMNVAISPVTITLYNYFCSHDDKEEINRIKNLITIFAAFIVGVAFPAKFVLVHFIPKYVPSTEILFVLFSAKILSIIIQGIYVNLYKAKKRQKSYLAKLLACIGFGVLFNALGYCVFPGNISFAIATLVAVFVWFLVSAMDFREVVYSFADVAYVSLAIVALNLCGILLDAVLGCVAYYGFLLAISLLLQKRTFIYLVKDVVMPTLRLIALRR